MCGFYFSNNENKADFTSKLERINHRGPDHTGIYHLDKNYFGHKRLSIIDLDARSHQPFIHNNYVLLFNGEIYNYREIKENLKKEGYTFKTNSDTEVLLLAYDFYKEKLPSLLNGMFAFLIFDKTNSILFGARDRTGQKPLFYATVKDKIEFSSELGPLIKEDFEIDHHSLGRYFLYGTVSNDSSLIKGVKKVKPAHYFEYSLTNKKIKFTKYWSNVKTPSESKKTDESYFQELENLFNDSTKKRLLESDVKTGVFLSGGIDSSLVTKYAAKNQNNVSTLSIVFQEDKFNEHQYSKVVSEKYKTNHKSIICSLNEVKGFIGKIGEYLDEPMADASFLSQLLISKIARDNGFKVVLTGDGADEYFFGYRRYLWVKKALFLKKTKLNKIIYYKFLPKKYRRYFEVLKLEGTEMYNFLMSGLELKSFKKISKKLNTNYQDFPSKSFDMWDSAEIDKEDYLVNDINIKVDRATMAFSIESRSPFLDYRILDFANRLPNNLKLKNRDQKYILKRILKSDFDDSFIHRKKQGFGVPLGKWLQEEFYEELVTLIENGYSYLEDFFEKEYLYDLLNELKEGNHRNHHILWRFYVFFKWVDRVKEYAKPLS